ncbi:hypothetical protein ACFPRL_20275 [Pseudoclavibacter helvolus]
MRRRGESAPGRPWRFRWRHPAAARQADRSRTFARPRPAHPGCSPVRASTPRPRDRCADAAPRPPSHSRPGGAIEDPPPGPAHGAQRPQGGRRSLSACDGRRRRRRRAAPSCRRVAWSRGAGRRSSTTADRPGHDEENAESEGRKDC